MTNHKVDHSLSSYQQRLHLQNAVFSLIDHEDASVAIVYKITQSGCEDFILKICTRANDYLREVYFLKYFASLLPVPRVLQIIEPEKGLHGAILMECIPGSLLRETDLNDEIAYESGSLLARIHLNRTAGYGDLIQPSELYSDPRVHFTMKFEEGFAECNNHLPKILLDHSRIYYDTHVHLLTSADGPCIVHRDFRPGNLIVYDGKIQGIIDWASGRASFSEEDTSATLVTAINSMIQVKSTTHFG